MKERHDQAMKEMKAASVITAGARGRIARKETGRARNVRLQRERDREHAASKIQSHVRGKRDRTQLNGEYDERSARAERNRIRHEREDKAARVIQRKINELEHKIKCHVCGDREKNCVITRCFHVFCRTCIDDNVKNRIRKCPACSLPFGDKDTHDIYLVA